MRFLVRMNHVGLYTMLLLPTPHTISPPPPQYNVLQEYVARMRRERGEDEGEGGGRVAKEIHGDGEWFMNGEYVESRISSGLHKKIMEVKERIMSVMRAEGGEVGEAGGEAEGDELLKMRKKVKVRARRSAFI